MIFNWLWRRLPPWLAIPVCGGVYAFGMLLLWWRWELPSAPFRYVGL